MLNIGYEYISFSDILTIIGKQIPLLNSSIDLSSLSPKFESYEAIILQIRLPRIVAGIIIGAGLAASGVLYQGVFKNPMADPFVLGVSTGASVGAGVGILLGSGLNLLRFSIYSNSSIHSCNGYCLCCLYTFQGRFKGT